MKNADVVRKFLNGETKGKAGNLHIEGDKLINYFTVIAQRINGVVHINTTKYSMSTTTVQNMIVRELYNAPTVQDVPKGASDLRSHVPVAQ